jgi:hypothetical protein
MKWFCRHDWQQIDKHVFRSAFYQINNAGQKLTSLRGMDEKLFADKVVWVFKCSKCNDLKKVESEGGCH